MVHRKSDSERLGPHAQRAVETGETVDAEIDGETWHLIPDVAYVEATANDEPQDESGRKLVRSDGRYVVVRLVESTVWKWEDEWDVP